MTDINVALVQLANYGVDKGLLSPADRTWCINRFLAVLKLDRFEAPESVEPAPLENILGDILDWAVQTERIDGGPAGRDLLDTELMAVLTPRPPPTGTISSLRTPTTSAPTALPGTSSG